MNVPVEHIRANLELNDVLITGEDSVVGVIVAFDTLVNQKVVKVYIF